MTLYLNLRNSVVQDESFFVDSRIHPVYCEFVGGIVK
jgi:hypothetical protein